MKSRSEMGITMKSIKKQELPEFDNHDERIKYYGLILERDLDGFMEYSLPAGYRFVFYKHGDRDAWIEIEQSAKEFQSYEKGLESWNVYYAMHEEDLPDRMVFIENESGEKIATASAYYDVSGQDTSGDGWLHWVAVKREYQGRRLSKPLITYVLHVMKELGYTHAKIPTQTNTWLACKVYLDLGFLPTAASVAQNRIGWNVVKTLTGHPALESFEEASLEEILESANGSR